MSIMRGKWALITGASSGIGQACARRLAADGANLLLAARRLPRLLELKKELEETGEVKVLVFELDVRNRAAVEALAEELRAKGLIPWALVNNAGLASGLSKLHEGDFEDWDKMMETNVTGLLNVSRYVLPLMVERNEGHVVNIGSIAGHQVYPGGNVYNASKFAVRAINEGMNMDLLGTGLRVSGIDPGMVETEFSLVRFHGDRSRAESVYQGVQPLTGEDIADAVAYVLNAPRHVNILDMVILPTAQRSAYHLHRG